MSGESNAVLGYSLAIVVSSSYVLSLYMVPAHIRVLSRDHPTHIYYRMIFSSFATLLSVMLCYCMKSYFSNGNFLELIGFKFDRALYSAFISVSLMFVFYLGRH